MTKRKELESLMLRVLKALSTPNERWTPKAYDVFTGEMLPRLCTLWNEVEGATWEWVGLR